MTQCLLGPYTPFPSGSTNALFVGNHSFRLLFFTQSYQLHVDSPVFVAKGIYPAHFPKIRGWGMNALMLSKVESMTPLSVVVRMMGNNICPGKYKRVNSFITLWS